MREELFNETEGEILALMTPVESIDDLEQLYTTIVLARRQRRHRGKDDEGVALFSLCFFNWPGKAPKYREQIVRLREAFHGIAHSPAQQIDFRARLKPRLLDARSVEELAPLHTIQDVFDVNDQDLGRGVQKLGLPPKPAPTVHPYGKFTPQDLSQPPQQSQSMRGRC